MWNGPGNRRGCEYWPGAMRRAARHLVEGGIAFDRFTLQARYPMTDGIMTVLLEMVSRS